MGVAVPVRRVVSEGEERPDRAARRGTGARIAAVVLLGAAAFGIATAGLRLAQPPPAPAVWLSAATAPDPTAGIPAPVATPVGGSLDVEDDSGRRLATRAADQVRPIGSVAKTMTALLVLQRFPLRPGELGATYTITAQDVADYHAVVAANGSNLPVTLGEQLSERDLLLGLMLPSANNLAVTLARWTAGDQSAFVVLMNARAAALGMAHTHFDDASGFSPATVSTADDLVRLGRAALANPGLADIVATAKAPLPPDGAQYYNLDSLLGTTPGWLGIKTGETPSAGACLLFAARRPLAEGQTVLLVGAILGQPQLADALSAARSAVFTAASGYVVIDWAATRPLVRGAVEGAWGAHARVSLGAPVLARVGTASPAQAASGATASVLRRGDGVAVTSTVLPLRAPLEPGARVGTVEARTADGQLLVTWSVMISSALSGPSIWWRIVHG